MASLTPPRRAGPLPRANNKQRLESWAGYSYPFQPSTVLPKPSFKPSMYHGQSDILHPFQRVKDGCKNCSMAIRTEFAMNLASGNSSSNSSSLTYLRKDTGNPTLKFPSRNNSAFSCICVQPGCRAGVLENELIGRVTW